tara:strand:+ start:422 stop:562 length:141 start_codon:yes stop_codon:yes gene_type:complete
VQLVDQQEHLRLLQQIMQQIIQVMVDQVEIINHQVTLMVEMVVQEL